MVPGGGLYVVPGGGLYVVPGGGLYVVPGSGLAVVLCGVWEGIAMSRGVGGSGREASPPGGRCCEEIPPKESWWDAGPPELGGPIPS